MKIVALVSGGKDSCYNMMQCVANGHEIVALANLKPPASSGKDELDSFMYQTVGHDAIHLYSECMQIPLYRREILGGSVSQGSDYKVTENDETEDLYLLLKDVLANHPDVKGVSVGAILSNYQRVRVEHICNRLGLTSFAFLWRRNQKELLFEMANAGVDAVLIKIAAIGLKPVHLGRSIAQMYPYLCQMNEMYDLHICGEGGEYETFTLDCPLFKKKIIIEETETVIHSDDAFAQVAYFRFKKLSVVDKTEDEFEAGEVVIQDWREWERYDDIISVAPTSTLEFESKSVPVHVPKSIVTQSIDSTHAPFFAISGTTAFDQSSDAIFDTIEDETMACMKAFEKKLKAADLDWSDLVTMNVFVTDMNDFGRINAVYKQFFDINPSPRALVGAKLSGKARLQMDAVAIKAIDQVKRETMHVQGISYWAPANIGPYSQSVITQGHAYVAGQIGLVPHTLDLPTPSSFTEEAALSLRNLENIVSVLELSLTSDVALCCCFVSNKNDLPLAKAAWEAYHDDIPPTLYIAVPALPRGALVEWQVMLNTLLPTMDNYDDDTTDDEQEAIKKIKMLQLNNPKDVQQGKVQSRVLQKSNMTTMVVLATEGESVNDIMKQLAQSIDNNLKQMDNKWNQVLSIRTFYRDDLDMCHAICSQLLINEINSLSSSIPTVTSIPVNAIADSIIACAIHVL